MTIEEYLMRRHGTGSVAPMHCECRALGIEWPLRAGWRATHGGRQITAAMHEALAASLRRAIEVSPDKVARRAGCEAGLMVLGAPTA